jgi:hypothetical protein
MYQLARVAPDRTVTPTVLPASYFGDMARGDVMANHRLTQEQFIAKCRAVHGDRYDYLQTVYRTARDRVTVVCRKHGPFEQVASSHVRGNGCKACADADTSARRTKTQQEAIADFQKVHGDRYDYSLVKYENANTPVTIVCPEHGSFEQKPREHSGGSGCQKCRDDATGQRFAQTEDEVITDFRRVHGSRYDYSLVDYKTATKKVKIICPEHGVFEKAPYSHKNGSGCLECYLESRRMSDFLDRAKRVHGDLYIYDSTEYDSSGRRVKIICREHGEFEQLPFEHLSGSGCRLCANKKIAEARKIPDEDWIARFREAHGDRYAYNDDRNIESSKKITITCRKHGYFEQLVSAHAVGRGCPKCAVEERFQVSQHSRSTGEREVDDYIASIGFETQHGYLPDSDNRWTFDVVVPGTKLAVEFNGVYWHSYPRAHCGQHYHKRKNAEAHGYRLITIWEDDWRFNRSRMESLLRRVLLGPQTKIGARVTEVSRVDHGTAKAFHEEHHIQDFRITVANQHYALFDSADLVAVASFDRKGTLHRYTVLDGLSIAGGLSKLIKAFRGEHGPLPIVTFCDRDYFDARVYRAAGFEKTGGQLTMSYAVNGRRQRREAYMKHKLPALFGAIDETEKEIDICATNGVFACWNSGTERFELSA